MASNLVTWCNKAGSRERHFIRSANISTTSSHLCLTSSSTFFAGPSFTQDGEPGEGASAVSERKLIHVTTICSAMERDLDWHFNESMSSLTSFNTTKRASLHMRCWVTCGKIETLTSFLCCVDMLSSSATTFREFTVTDLNWLVLLQQGICREEMKAFAIELKAARYQSGDGTKCSFSGSSLENMALQ